VKDAGMFMSEAYFGGINDRRIELMKQLDVTGLLGE
jgi:hypothetical protein